jgi:hypothetical protein
MTGPEAYERLVRQFGLGDFPLIRKRLFSRLAREIEMVGDVVLFIVRSCAQDARVLRDRNTGGIASAESQARWFCAAVSRRLREHGFLQNQPSATPAAATKGGDGDGF